MKWRSSLSFQLSEQWNPFHLWEHDPGWRGPSWWPDQSRKEHSPAFLLWIPSGSGCVHVCGHQPRGEVMKQSPWHVLFFPFHYSGLSNHPTSCVCCFFFSQRCEEEASIWPWTVSYKNDPVPGCWLPLPTEQQQQHRNGNRPEVVCGTADRRNRWTTDLHHSGLLLGYTSQQRELPSPLESHYCRVNELLQHHFVFTDFWRKVWIAEHLQCVLDFLSCPPGVLIQKMVQ